MNTWEKIPFKDCYRGTRRSHGLPWTWQFEGLRMTSWCDGSFTRNPVFGMGELFLSQASLWSQCCPRERAVCALGRCLIWHLDAKSSCPCAALQPLSPPAKQTWFLTLLKELKGHLYGFCRSRVSGKMLKNHWFIGPSKSPAVHHKVLPVDVNKVDKK